MKKRLLALLAVLCLTTSMFGACGKEQKNDMNPTPEPTATTVLEVTEKPEPTATNTPQPTATSTPTPQPTATTAPTPEPTATSTPQPTATPAPTETPTLEPTKTPSGPATLTYNFNDLKYNSSYGTTYTVLEDASISLQYTGIYQEIKLALPVTLDMSYCTGVTVKLKSETGNLAVKLYDEDFKEVSVNYNCKTTGIGEAAVPYDAATKVAGIGLMACESNLEDYSLFDATVYSITFQMKEGYDSGTPAPTPTPIPFDPNVFGVWENNADISWIDTSRPMIAFTFDDGPIGTSDTATSIRIQDALAASGQHATFFYVGNKINDSNRGEIKRAYDMGFEIGNHTFCHWNLSEASVDSILQEIHNCKNILTEITGLEHFLVRPPYLATNTTVKNTVFEPMINCSIDTKDWDGATTEDIINKITSQKKDGAIVLMHENYATTAEAMEILIPQLVAEGWQIVSVSELFKAKGLELKDGEVYNNAK